MNTEYPHFPPLAQALGRLRQPARVWPYAPRPAELIPARPADTEHDFLRILPEPAFTGELPAAPAPKLAAPIPGAEAARIYWFDL